MLAPQTVLTSIPTAALTTWQSRLATVPGKLRLAQIGVIAVAVIFSAFAYTTYADIRNAVQTVGVDTVPSIVAAEEIRATLADANANVVNFFLTNEPDTGASWLAYTREMEKVQKDLLVASQNITFGDEERQPIMAMMTKLSAYERLIGQARGHRQTDFHPDMEVAEQIMRNDILPAALALDQANFSHLTQTYDAFRSHFVEYSMPMIVCMILLLGGLIVTQLYVMRRTQRIMNPGLALATIALVAWAAYAATILPHAESSLKAAKEDAFDSVHALWQARAVAYDANADESFYLLDHGKRDKQAEWSDSFTSKTALLADGDATKIAERVTANNRIKGYLGDELANITYPGEKELALETLEAWGVYMQIDKKIRELESAGQYKDALALNIGVKPGESNWAFSQFDSALGKTLELNHNEFNAAIQHANKLLASYCYCLALGLLIMVLATFFGLKPRIDEYRF